MRAYIAVLLLAATALAIPHVREVSKVAEGAYQEILLETRGLSCGTSGGSKLSKSEQKAYLKEHNECRGKEGAGLADLKWNDILAAKAQELVDKKNCQMQHDIMNCGDRMGQNLAWDWASNTPSGNMEASKAVGMWYDEKKDYNYNSNSCRGVCGHYTQIVWKDTKEVGCAAKICGNERLVACDYYPAGNYIGKKPY